MKTARVLIPVWLLVAVSTQALAQNTASQLSLKMRLRAQILNLVPTLRHGGNFPEGADGLALPMAQLGDWDAAERLATQTGTRDGLHHWKSKQLAIGRQYAAAIPVAQRIKEAGTRADGLMLIARLALDNGEPEAARAPLLGAMRALETSPDSAQLAYAAWLWNQSGDGEAARRVLWQRALPRALKENEIEKQEMEKQYPAMAPYRADNEAIVFDFASQMGWVSDIIAKSKPSDGPRLSWILSRARSRHDFQLLRQWLQTTTPAPHNLMILAYAAARLGLKPEARELRDQARLGLQPLKTQPRERVGALYLELVLAATLGEDDEVKRLENELKMSQDGSPESEEWALLGPLLRLTNLEDLADAPRLDVDAASLELAASEILAAPPSRSQLNGLKSLVQIDANRRNRARLASIAVATARNVERGAQQYQENRRQNRGSSWSNEPFEIAKILRQVQAGSEAPIVAALLKSTPTIFRPASAFQFYQNGFPIAARQIFDPLAQLNREFTLKNRIDGERDPKKRQILESQQTNVDWGDFAATQARYDAPDAPARWIGRVRDERVRVEIWKAWAGAFSQQVELKPPYVRRVGNSRSYRVGGSAGSSLGSRN